MAKLTQAELERHLWGAADILRGTVDAGDYKPSENAEVQALRDGLEAYYLDTEGEKDAKKRFKANGQQPSFLIVCDKLLTGFDAPIEHVMYLDKPLKEWSLLTLPLRVPLEELVS